MPRRCDRNKWMVSVQWEHASFSAHHSGRSKLTYLPLPNSRQEKSGKGSRSAKGEDGSEEKINELGRQFSDEYYMRYSHRHGYNGTAKLGATWKFTTRRIIGTIYVKRERVEGVFE